MAKSQTKGPAQTHIRYQIRGTRDRKETATDRLNHLAKENPGTLMAAIASLTGGDENGLTDKQAKGLIEKYLLGKTRQCPDTNPEGAGI